GARTQVARGLSMAASLASLAWALLAWSQFDSATGTLQLVERHDWIPSLAVQYYLGVDGLSLLMVLLTGVVVPMAMVASWRMDGRQSLHFALILMLESGLFGTFTALNFFHWFLFWELSLVPAFFLIKLWGGKERGPAALQFFIYTMVGRAAMRLAFVGLFIATGTFDFLELARLARKGELAQLVSTKLSGFGLSGS